MEFIEALRQAGFLAPKVEPGKLTRFPGVGKKSGDSGWCILFDHQRFGLYGDHALGIEERWSVKKDSPPVPYKPRPDYELARKKAQEQAMFSARKMLRTAKLELLHPYAVRKHIEGELPVYSGKIVLPIYDLGLNRVVNVQLIAPDGEKRFLKGGKIKGCFGIVGQIDRNHVAVCEGLATACTVLRQYDVKGVAVALSASNLEPVIEGLRTKKNVGKITIFADDDRKSPANPGKSKALAAGKKWQCEVIVPNWPAGCPDDLTDFNDLEGWLFENA